ncbi:MAG: diacylglycerol kinase family protein [Myxococcota bacterium]
MAGSDVVLLCNPRAGGRWKELARILDSDEAKSVTRIVTDSVEDVGPALLTIGREAKLLCIYGGDGTIQRVLDRLPADRGEDLQLALIGGGTMNVTSHWCGFVDRPADHFRYVVNGYRTGNLLLREVPLLEVQRGPVRRRGFTFAMGPMVRVLDAFERGHKSKRAAVTLGVRTAVGAWLPMATRTREMLVEMEAQVELDGERLPFDRFAAVFANTTGQINPGIVPFRAARDRDTFYVAAYAAPSREVALAIPILARGLLPRDTGSLLQRLSPFERDDTRSPFKSDPRYVNRTARRITIDTAEPLLTVDGELITSDEALRVDVNLGLRLRLAVSPTAALRPGLRRAANAVGAVKA